MIQIVRLCLKLSMFKYTGFIIFLDLKRTKLTGLNDLKTGFD